MNLMDITAKQEKKCISCRPPNGTSGLTIGLFGIFPIILFSIILVSKLKENYDEQVNHLGTNLKKIQDKESKCQEWTDLQALEVKSLEVSQVQCKRLLGKASLTLTTLNMAFRKHWDKADQIMVRLNHSKAVMNSTLDQFSTLANVTWELRANNSKLSEENQSLVAQMSNLTHDNLELIEKLERLKVELNDLRSNTSRLKGEKEGLEKVLKVKIDEPEAGNGSNGNPSKAELKDEDKDSIVKMVEEQLIQKLHVNASSFNNATQPQ